MSVILRLGAVNTENPYSRLVSDGTEYDPPVDMSPVADEAYHSPPQTYPGCFGLSYQDHNYGAPPPPTPPQTPPPIPAVKESLDIKEEIVVTTDTTMVVAPDEDIPHCPPIDPPVDDDVDDPTRCICDFIHDDGYMIQCDKCSVWQHIVCMGLDRDSIPDTYLCELCHPRPVDRARAKEFQIRKREFLKNLLIKTHDSSTDTDPEEVNNRLKAYGLDAAAANAQNNAKPKQKMKMKKRKERNNSRNSNKKVKKEITKEKENTNKEINKKNKLLVKDFSSRTAQAKKEKLTKKIEKMRAERISKEMREDKFSSDDLKEDEKIINNTMNTIPAPVVQDENAQNPWEIINTFNEWEQSYEVAKYNQYTTYVQEYLNSTYINGHHNDIADLVTDGLRVQRCHIKELKNKKKGLQASSTIPDGQPIIEVIGKVMTRQQYDKDNFGQRQLSPFVFFYGKVFDLDMIIDASDYGNDARFIRRSCQANAVVRHVVAGGQAHFITVSTREILEDTEITIPFDYDYKKWNFCVECACLRNSCPVSRYQKRRLRFQKLKIDQAQKKFKIDKSPSPKSEVKSPVKSPTKSPIKSPVRTPEKLPPEREDPISPQIPETVQNLDPVTPSPTKMVRRSQVMRSAESYTSAQQSASGRRSLRVPSQPDNTETIADPVTKPEPSNLRSSEVDPLTSPETNKEPKDPLSGDTQDQPQEKRKLTREERKMQAIMKAFEKMEKRNARKQSVDHNKVKEKDEKKTVVKKEPEKEYVVKEEEVSVKIEAKVEIPKVVSPVKLVLSEVQQPAEITETNPEEATVTESRELEGERTLNIEVKEEDPLQIVVKQEVKQRSQSKGKKAKKTANRRRTRNSSGAASNSNLEPPAMTDFHEDNSNSSLALVSCPTTPVPIAIEENSSSSTATTPSFKFLKTKRHLMNEWLIEKSCDSNISKPAPVGAMKSEPLEVAVEEEESMYVTCLPSPRNSMDRLRRNSQSCGSRDRHSNSVESTGSAKKRWLRQAMGEGTSDSGLVSPGIAAGGMSPNPQVAMPSPGGSPPTDFVTPLKKRRLARESLSRESYSSESPCQTPTPSTAIASTSGLNPQEEFAERLEQLKEKNGINSFFAPLRTQKPSCSGDEDMDKSEINVLSSEKTEDREALCEEPRIRHSSQEDMSSVTSVGQSQESTSFKPPVEVSDTTTSEVVSEESGVSSCAEIDCSIGYNKTGSSSATPALSTSCREEDVISKTDSSFQPSLQEEQGNRTAAVDSEQMLVCDGVTKSANSEPDSSDSAGQQFSETPMEVECDSGSTHVEEQTSTSDLISTGEVDSTESRIHPLPPVIHTTEAQQSEMVEASDLGMASENDGCDSCFDERVDKQVGERHDSLGFTSSADKLCSSSSPASVSSVTSEKVNSSMDVTHFTKHSSDRLSVVDSSTDKPVLKEDQCTNIVTNSSSSITHRQIPEASGLDPIASISGFEPVTGSVRSSFSTLEPETGIINSTIENVPQISIDSFGPTSTNITDSLLTSSLATVDTPSVPNRHLRFLTDCQLNTEMVVDSTTHYMPSLLSGTSIVNSSGLSGMGTAYDSDSMDVTSGSDLTSNGMVDDTRKSDDSLSSFPDNLASRGPGDLSLIPKEKKRVSLQEYLKRKKEKYPGVAASTVTSTCTSVGGASNKVVSSTTTSSKSPLRMTASINLDKLPPLPSLPSLPMFEKTERKEFKSSSDLLSPIFNRKEKQGEVRKPMSLSERLRQEFGLDDSTDTDTDTENKDHKSGENDDELDVPPPPPPPPPQSLGTRAPGGLKLNQVSNGSAIPSLMSLKTFHTPLIKPGDSGSTPVISTSHSGPSQFSAGIKPHVAAQAQLGPSQSKPQISSMPQSLLSMLSNVKSPAQLQNDLTSQLNALKAQINKVQQSLPVSSSTSLGNSVLTDQLPVPVTSVNGASGGPTTSAKPQVFDYGHQSSANFMRQNSYPSSSSSSTSKHLYHNFNKSPSNINFGKTSPGYNKLSPGFSKHSPSAASHNSQLNNHGYHGNSHHSNIPSPGWNQKPSNSHKHLSSSSSSSNQRKHFSKQSSHKYS